MVKNLTWRRLEAICCMYWRIQNYSFVKYEELVGDMGVSFNTLPGHLIALKEMGLVDFPKDPKSQPFGMELKLTTEGIKVAVDTFLKINATKNTSLPTIQEQLRNLLIKSTESKDALFGPVQLGLNLARNSAFSKTFNELIITNPTEPVLTSIAMYTELDGKLNAIKKSQNIAEKKLYENLSKSQLNLEIRNARIASIGIPLAMRKQMTKQELDNILSESWVWQDLVDRKSLERYYQESMSTGLMQYDGQYVRSLKPSATDTINWLAQKTNWAFQNNLAYAPKANLVVYRESFKFPTAEELLNPELNDKLDWSAKIQQMSSNKSTYKTQMLNSIEILKDKTGILEEFENHLVPSTTLRRIKSNSEIEKEMSLFLKTQDELIPSILLIINAKPGITIFDLSNEIRSKAGPFSISTNIIEDIIEDLTRKNLIYQARGRDINKKLTKLFSFTQIPYIDSNKNANAYIKNYEPYILSEITSTFNPKEREILNKIITDITRRKKLSFDDLEREYGDKEFNRKFLRFIHILEPMLDIENNEIKLTKGSDVEGVLMGTIQYALLAKNDALNVYADAISNVVNKIKSLSSDKIKIESDQFKQEYIQRKLKDFGF
jgi:DNA-binding transcriptional ArsR family regulator